MILRPALLLTVALSVAACTQPQPEASPTPLPELAVEPDAVATTPRPVDEPTQAATPGPAAVPPGTPGAGPAGGSSATNTEPSGPGGDPTETGGGQVPDAREYATFHTFEDRMGDEGLEAPSYADLRQVTFQDDRQNLRVWVDVGADIPAALSDGEVIGLGVDLFVDEGRESDYQLFADGGSDGWRAYFHTPRGFVAYPGTFAIGGRRIEFVIPWGSLGTPPGGQTRVFLDWSEARPILNAAGSDRAPDRGTTDWAR